MNRKSNTPKRKRLKRPARLALAKSWMKEYCGKNIINGYVKWFGVDKICAINELKMIGVVIPENLERQIIESVKARIIEKQRIREKMKNKEEHESFIDSDENFAYIIGYTSGGAAYGLTWEEFDMLEEGISQMM
jgi:hypothetical protein